MSADFTTATSRVDCGSLALEPDVPFTVLAMIQVDSTGVSNTSGRISQGAGCDFYIYNASTSQIRFDSWRTTTDASSPTASGQLDASTSVWRAVAAIHTDLSSSIALWKATLGSTRTIMTLAGPTNGSGAKYTGDPLTVGNSEAANRAWDGRISHYAIIPRAISQADFESYANGNMTALWSGATAPLIFLPLQSNAVDLSTRANPTASVTNVSFDNVNPAGITFTYPSSGSVAPIAVHHRRMMGAA